MNTIHQTKREQAQQLHDQAMDTAEQAVIARTQGKSQFQDLFWQAFLYERDAANTLSADYAFEPSRSILHRSAAALALECEEWRAAEQLIGAALAGSPPEEIAEELRQLWKQVYALRKHANAA